MLGVPPGQNLDHGRRRQVDNTAVFAYPATNPQTPGGPTMDLQILTTISTGVALAALVWTLSRGPNPHGQNPLLAAWILDRLTGHRRR